MKTLGIIRIIIGVLIMLGAYALMPDRQPWYYSTIVFVIGFNVACYPKLKKTLSSLFGRSATILIIAMFASSAVFAQDYTKQDEGKIIKIELIENLINRNWGFPWLMQEGNHRRFSTPSPIFAP